MLEIVHRYKYGRQTWFEPFLIALFLKAAAPAVMGGAWDGIIPVPLHPLREREREFNQAERLAAALARATGVPLLKGVARRLEATRTQALLDRKDRAKNVARAFEIRKGALLDGRRLLVVDDVLTTGSTTSALSRVLKRAGAERVEVWTLARGV